MNVCHRYKLIWWATSRCASRYTSSFLGPLGFYNYDDSDGGIRPTYGFNILFPQETPTETVSFSHKIDIPEGFSDYDVIANIRNPYDVFYSNYRLEMMEYLRGRLHRQGIYEIPSPDKIEMSFSQWAAAKFEYYRNTNWDVRDSIYELSSGNIKYLIRYETLNDDIMAIPQVAELYKTNDVYRNTVDYSLNSTKSDYRNSLVLKDETFKDVYTQELADEVYTYYKPQFDLFNYDRDSWKH